MTSGRRSLHENSLPLPDRPITSDEMKIDEREEEERDLSVRSPLKRSGIDIENSKLGSAAKNPSQSGGFETFRKGSPDFRHASMLQEESKNEHAVYESPLFMKKSLMASLKKSL